MPSGRSAGIGQGVDQGRDRRKQLDQLALAGNGKKLDLRFCLGSGRLFTLLLSFVLNCEAEFAGSATAQGVLHRVRNAEFLRAVDDHGPPGDTLYQHEVSFQNGKGSEQTGQACQGVKHGVLVT